MEGSDRGLFAESRNLLGENEENYENTSVGMADAQAKIRTEHLPNTGLDSNRYTTVRQSHTTKRRRCNLPTFAVALFQRALPSGT
jgi:hypothetical protein